MGSKYQKKCNSFPFRGNELIPVQSAIDVIGSHITITTFGTFIPEVYHNKDNRNVIETVFAHWNMQTSES